MEGSLKELAVIIKNSSLCREKLDYDDFCVAGHAEVEEQLNLMIFELRNSHNPSKYFKKYSERIFF